MNDLSRCPVCHNLHGGLSVFQGYRRFGGYRIKCGVCGDFDVSEEAVTDFLENPIETGLTPARRAVLSHLVRREQKPGGDFSMLKSDVIEAVIRDGVALPAPPAQAASALALIADEVTRSGKPLKHIPEHLYASIGAIDRDASARIVRALIDRGLLRGIDVSSNDGEDFIDIDVTLDGWDRLTESQSPPAVTAPPPVAAATPHVTGAEVDEIETQSKQPSFWARGKTWAIVIGVFLIGLVAFLANLTTIMSNVSSVFGGVGRNAPASISLLVTIENADVNEITVGELMECTPIETGGQRPIEYPTLRSVLHPAEGSGYIIRGNQEAHYRIEFDNLPWLQTLIDRGGADLYCRVATVDEMSLRGSAWFPLQEDMINSRRMLIRLNEPS